MGKGYELEKRVLAMISEQYEGIYQLNLADKKVICIYDGRDAWGPDDVLDRDIWRDRLVGLCHPEDKENLQSVLAEDSLFLLGKKEAKTDKISRDFRFMIEQGYRWINLMLVPDPAHGQITVTFRDVTHRYEYDEIIRRKNMELRRMLQTAEQYRDALLTESVVLYQVNFSKNLIENEIFQRDKKTNGMVRVLNTVGIHTPCAYDEYCARWQGRVSKDTLAEYRKFSSASYMVEAYQDGKTLLRQDYRTLDSTGEEMWINKTIYLTKDNIQGDIIGIVSLRNVTDRYRQDYLRESLEKQASLDLLTGLYNHVTGELLIKSKINGRRGAEFGIALLAFFVDACTANNTVAIVMTGPIAKEISEEFDVDPRRSASLLDMFTSVGQGIIPYGAQLLSAATLTGLTPLQIIPNLYYPLLMGVCGVLAIIFRPQSKKNYSKVKW